MSHCVTSKEIIYLIWFIHLVYPHLSFLVAGCNALSMEQPGFLYKEVLIFDYACIEIHVGACLVTSLIIRGTVMLLLKK